MAVVSVKVPEGIKKRMRQVEINWSEEIRSYILKKIKETEKEQKLKEIREMIRGVKVHKGTASALVREDRDSH
jgi:anaerobic ribonucleoside-triphosphate reductase